MKAVQINKYGGVDVLELNEQAVKPSLKPGQVLIEAYAASINPFDWKLRAGYMKDMAPIPFPATLGGDFAGVIVELGEGVSDLKVGEEVYGSAMILGGGSGAFAEMIAANTATIDHKPKSANFEEAASLVLVGVSALQVLEEHIKLKPQQKILIHGGAGGIGSAAIQLAKSIGAHIATTVSTGDKAFATELGADEVIDYKTEKFEEKLKDFDAVFDTVGGETATKSFQVLKKGGVIVSMLGQPDPLLAEKFGVTAIGQGTQTNTERLNRLAKLVDDGKIKAHIEKSYHLEQAKEAFKHLEEDHPKGKIVLKIK